jgi:uncharacterized membrane protein
VDARPADPGVVANERLTGLASGALLALLIVVLATTPRLGPGPVVASALVTIITLVAVRPYRWS